MGTLPMHSQRLKIELMPVSLVSQEAGFWQGNQLFFPAGLYVHPL